MQQQQPTVKEQQIYFASLVNFINGRDPDALIVAAEDHGYLLEGAIYMREIQYFQILHQRKRTYQFHLEQKERNENRKKRRMTEYSATKKRLHLENY